MENKKINITNIIVFSVVTLTLIISVSFAYIFATIKGAPTTDLINAGNIDITFTSTSAISCADCQLISDADVLTKAANNEFTITNPNSRNIYYKILLSDITISENLKSADFKWRIYNGENIIAAGDFSNIENDTYTFLNVNKVLEPSNSETLKLYIWLSETEEDQTSLLPSSFSAKIRVDSYFTNKVYLNSLVMTSHSINLPDGLLGNTATTNENLITSPESNGNFYILRGNITDNYVQFANMLWRIVGIGQDGSIKLITEQTTPSTRFNLESNNEKYVSLIYDNGTESNIMNSLNAWYQNNLLPYDSQIVYKKYCIDTKILSTSSYGAIDFISRYSRRNDLKCSDPDRPYGGLYNLKIGLLSYQEALFAGLNKTTANSINYLNNGSGWYTLTPDSYRSYGAGAHVVTVNSAGMISDAEVTQYIGYRPVINLAASSQINGGTGTSTNPYIIK